MKYDLNIFDFEDYRALISAFYEAKNAKMKGNYSYRAFAKEAGFSSPNYISLIVQGKKNISEEGIHRLSEAMALSKRERFFFETLVYFNQSKTSLKRDHYLRRLIGFKEFAVGRKLLKDQYEYFSVWYNVALRELVSLPTFRYDTEWMARMLFPPITAKEAKEAFDRLYALGFVQRDRKGKWHLCDAHLHTDREVHSTVVMNFHREMIARSMAALEQNGKDRDFSAVTMAVSREQFEEIKEKTAAFREEIQRYLSENPQKPDRVCQLNFQLFHLTKP